MPDNSLEPEPFTGQHRVMRGEVSRARTSRRSVGRSAPHPLSDGVVTLRMPTSDDVDQLTRYGADHALLDGIWISGPPPAGNVRSWASAFLRELAAGWTEAGGMHDAGLIVDEREPFLGVVYMAPVNDDAVELSYGVAPPARGRGIATRAARLATDWALGVGAFARVELRIAEDHAASRRIAEKLGFRFVERYATYVTGTGLTHVDVLYACTKD